MHEVKGGKDNDIAELENLDFCYILETFEEESMMKHHVHVQDHKPKTEIILTSVNSELTVIKVSAHIFK